MNTAKLPVLTEAEQQSFLQKSKNGDETARNALICGNLRLVLSILQRFGNRTESADDLFQVGCIGLIKAIDNFNTELNVKFSTYAVPMIIGEIRRFLRDNNSIRVSRSMRDTAYRALSAKEALSSSLGREPTMEEIVTYLQAQGESCQKEDVLLALDAIVEPISLYEPIFHENGGTETLSVMDQIKDTENTDELWLEQLCIKDALRTLTGRERKIIDLRFYRGKTQMEIAQEIGISQAQVSRLEKSALAHMKKQL